MNWSTAMETKPVGSSGKVSSTKAYSCINCNRLYATQVNACFVTGRIPLLLPCGHSMCEECIIRAVKNKSVECLVCNYEMTLDENYKILRDYFPVDRYMFGGLISLNESSTIANPAVVERYSKPTLPYQPAGALFNSFSSDALFMKKKIQVEIPAQTTAKQLCSQHPSCARIAEWRCADCEELFCGHCNGRIHEAVRALRKHTRFPIDIADLSDFNVSCNSHSDTLSDYFCVSCDQMLCSKCVIKDHQGHEILSILEKNTQEIPVLKEILENAKKMVKRMKFTQQRVKQEVTANQEAGVPTNTEYQVMQHFASLHSCLQLMEKQILDECHRAQTVNIDSLNQISTQLENNLNKINPLVATGTLIANNEHLDKLVVSELNRRINDILKLPCILDGTRTDTDKTKFVVDVDMVKAIQEHCHIERSTSNGYRLVSLDDAPNETDLMPPSDELLLMSITSSSSSRKSSISSSSIRTEHSAPATKETNSSVVSSLHSRVSTATKMEETTGLVKDTVEDVIITHIISPSHFYVQLSKMNRLIDSLRKKYELHAENAAVPHKPQINNTYIVSCVINNVTSWYRGKVKNILHKGGEDLYEVFYIDYGNSAIVHHNQIKEMKAVLMKEPPFAHQCRLGGLISEARGWTKQVQEYMIKFITGSQQLQMLVLNVVGGTLEVDLLSAESASLRHALVFVGHARELMDETSHMSAFAHARLLLGPTRILSAIAKYNKEQICNVYVTCVHNPHHLYVQQYEHRTPVEKLEAEMKKHYKKGRDGNLIYAPEIGMLCAAVKSEGDKWRRAEVVELPGNAMVKVFFLDYGDTAIISWQNIRKFKQQFAKIDAQAIKVTLSDIIPAKGAGDGWSEEAINFLKSYTTDKVLKMLVKEPSSEQLSVTLYETTPLVDICINALLVKHQHAESTGESSLLVEYHNVLPGKEENMESKVYVEDVLKTVHAYASQDDDIAKNKNLKDAFYKTIVVVSVESPGCFYVTLPEWAASMRTLGKKLVEHYSNLFPVEKIWEVEDLCVARSNKDKLFYRAQVIEVLDNGLYKVFMKDVVRTEVLAAKHLFELDDSFTSIPDMSIKCELAGVRPTGGSDTWSATATEYFRELCGKFPQLDMTKLGEIVDTTLPVALVATIEEHGGPLEPTKVTKILLNKCLRDRGYALPNENAHLLDDEELATPDYSCVDSVTSQSATVADSFDDLLPISTGSRQTVAGWKPAYPLKEVRFKAYITYVNNNGHVFLQTDASKILAHNLQRLLNKYFLRTSPEPEHFWEPDQMCIVQYHLDKSFYRGVVLDTNASGTINVRLVDFGNEEECTHDELRSEIFMKDIPILATECKLHGVVAKTADCKWPIAILDSLHHIVVEKTCDVIVTEMPPKDSNELPVITLLLDNLNVNKEVMSWDWIKAETIIVPDIKIEDNESVIVEGEIDENEQNEDQDVLQLHELLNLSYSRVEVPHDRKSFEAVIINVIDYQTVVIEAAFAVDILQATEKQFSTLMEDINDQAPNQPTVHSPVQGMPCVALYSGDNQWYRAEIFSLEAFEKAGKIQLLFVDYGNLDLVDKKNVRIMKKEWIELPVQLIKCKLWGIEKADHIDLAAASKCMFEELDEKRVLVEIKRRQPELQVSLMDTETFELVYNKPIEQGVFYSTE